MSEGGRYLGHCKGEEEEEKHCGDRIEAKCWRDNYHLIYEEVEKDSGV